MKLPGDDNLVEIIRNTEEAAARQIKQVLVARANARKNPSFPKIEMVTKMKKLGNSSRAVWRSGLLIAELPENASVIMHRDGLYVYHTVISDCKLYYVQARHPCTLLRRETFPREYGLYAFRALECIIAGRSIKSECEKYAERQRGRQIDVVHG